MTKNKSIKKANIEKQIIKTDYYKYNKIIILIIIAFTFAIYGNSIKNDYALDDALVITQNNYVKKGFSGINDILKNDLFTGFFGKKKSLVEGGRYRPLSLVSFAIEHEFFGQNPHISHFLNVLFYSITGIFIYLLLINLFSPSEKKWYNWFAFIVALIWIAHPIHTEAVANIKGRDEIFSMMFSIWTLYLFVKYIDKQKLINLLYIFVIFFLGLMSKEMTLTFVVIIPLTIYYFKKVSIKEIIKPYVVIILATIIYFIMRQIAIGDITSQSIATELMNNSFLGMTFSQKYATIFFTLGMYIKLLFFPLTLTFDYYPYHIHIMNWGNIYVILSILIYLSLGIIALLGLKKKTIVSYGIWFYLISFSIVSNVFFSIGAFANERFMFMPSLGFVIAVVYLIIKFTDKINKNIATSFFALIIILFSVKTISRNKVWENDFRLFTNDVKTSFDSAKSTTSAGGKLVEESQKLKKIILQEKPTTIRELTRRLKSETLLHDDEINDIISSNDISKSLQKLENLRVKYVNNAINYLLKAVKIHPTYVDALLLTGNAYYEQNSNYKKTWEYYKKILEINPNYNLVYSNIKQILTDKVPVNDRFNIYKELYAYNPNNANVCYALGNIYGQYKNDLPNSIKMLNKAINLNPKMAKAYKDLGVAYGMSKQFNKAISVMLKSLKLNENDKQTISNLALTYNIIGKIDSANYYFEKVKTIK